MILVGEIMNKLFMGLDIGSVYTKGVIIDEYNNIIASSDINTGGDPIDASKKVIIDLKKGINLKNNRVVAIGTTGSARRLVGTMLDACVIKNEMISETIGTINTYPMVKSIIEIGGQSSKLMIIDSGEIDDYEINDLCMTGLFIDSVAKRLDIDLNEISNMHSDKIINLSSRCMLFTENDIIKKIQNGYKKEDIIISLCEELANNYVNNIIKDRKIKLPIVFNGGVSKNKIVVNKIQEILNKKIIVNKNSYLMGAIGIAIMARECGIEKKYNFKIDSMKMDTKIISCNKCNNRCEIVEIYKNNNLIDCWGNRCNNKQYIEKE